jgi:ATP-binding cassette subfamily C protein
VTSLLPVADAAQVRRAAGGEIRADMRAFAAMLALNALATAAGLVGPRLLGDIVDAVKASPGRAAVATVDRLALIIVAFTLAQIVLTRLAMYVGARFGERTAARVRERFLDRTLALPASVVEHVATGDLVARGTTDVATVATTLRNAVPEVFIALVQVVFIIGAVLLLDPLLGACALSCLAVIAIVLRWYLRRARTAYLAEGAANSVLAEILTTTAGGARTVEALSLHQRRIESGEAAIAAARQARLRTLWLRTVLFPSVDLSYTLPLVGALLIGAVLYDRGVVSLGTVVATAVYLRQLAAPLDAVLLWVEQVQQSGAAYARVEGLAAAPWAEAQDDVRQDAQEPAPVSAESAEPFEPADDRIRVIAARYAYEQDRDVLHGVDLEVRPGERLAVVGASGAGKSTLGRLLAGIDKPRTGEVTVGGVPVAELAPRRLRRQVVLVTQEHHVFHATLRENLLLARPEADDAQLHAALTAVDAAWADDLPAGLDTELGAHGHHLDGAQSQQLALARVVLADPHTVILDEATALLDPATARNTEHALAAVLQGRTVVAIAHRLQTAHDADRVVVMDAGVIAELGTHDELVANDGAYAALWRSWHGDGDGDGDGPETASP